MKGMGELAKSNKLNVEKAIEKVSELSATALGGLYNIDADTLTSFSNILTRRPLSKLQRNAVFGRWDRPLI